MRRRGEPVEVSIEPTNPIAAAKMSGYSAGRVGREESPLSLPTQVLETVGALPYLLDVRPRLEGARTIALRADDNHSHGMTLVVSYKERKGDEYAPDNSLASRELFDFYIRDHKILLQFGAGEASHTAMLDVVEGMTINIPGSYAEATIFDLSQSRQVTLTDQPTTWADQASASVQPHPRTSQYTTKAYAPYQVSVDLLDPPTMQDYKLQLYQALVARTIVTTS